MLNYSFTVVFSFGQGFISFGIFGLDKHLKTLKEALIAAWPALKQSQYNVQVCDGEMRMNEKLQGLSTVTEVNVEVEGWREQPDALALPPEAIRSEAPDGCL